MLRNLGIALALSLPLASSAMAAPSTGSVADKALKVLEARFAAQEDAATDLILTRERVDNFKFQHAKFQQTYEGIPVFQGEAIVHFRPDGRLFQVTDNLIRRIDLDTLPDLSEDEAVAIAIAEDHRPGEYTAAPEVDLLVMQHNGENHLVWRVQLRQEDGTHNTAMPVFFVDAHSADVVTHYDNLQTIAGTGSTHYSGTVNIEILKYSTKYYLEDAGKNIGTYDMKGGYFAAYNMSDSDTNFNASSQKSGVEAHWGATKTIEYFQSRFGRNGIDGNFGPGYYASVASASTARLSSRVRYGNRYNNAYWSGQYMTYGEGDGTTFTPLVSIDVAAHEFTHGVTQYEANLTYSNESGALNESMSDVFGAMVEYYAKPSSADYLIGEECYTPSIAGDFLRNMAEPHQDPNYGYTADDDPDHYSERYTGTSDNGGVHINSGIGNKAYYLVAEGGTHSNGGSMTGIGRSSAEQIWYLALSNYMTSGTNFAGARAATISAANQIFGPGSLESTAVASAWTLCGVN